MKKKLFLLKATSAIISFIFSSNFILAQDCSILVPPQYSYVVSNPTGGNPPLCTLNSVSGISASVSGLPTSAVSLNPVLVSGSTHIRNTNACLASSANSGPEYTYTFSYGSSSLPIRGYLLRITGGYVTNSTFSGSGTGPGIVNGNYVPSTPPPYPFTDIMPSPVNSSSPVWGPGGTTWTSYQITVKVRWTSPGPDNNLQFFGYTPSNGQGYLHIFAALTVNSPSAAVPGPPAGMSLSSPVSYSGCGWKVASYAVQNATTYSWSGGTGGIYNDITGPTVPENQGTYLCVKASNGCSASNYYCQMFYAPNNTSCGSSRFTVGDIKDEEAIKTEKLLISPNPVTDRLIIYIKTQGNYLVELTSASGQMSKRVLINGMKNSSIDVSAVPRGVYFVVVKNNDQIVEKKTVVLQ
jgi:Secretion system C-terminal sorting domain